MSVLIKIIICSHKFKEHTYLFSNYKFEITISISSSFDNIINIDDNKKIIKVVDLFGRETNKISNSVIFYIYDDGTVDKRFILK